MSISREHAMIIARETLGRNLKKYGITIEHIRAGGIDDLVKSAAWSTGIDIKADSGEVWRPSTQHLLPGSANYDAAVQADEEGRLTLAASDERRLAYLLDEAPRYKTSYEACKYVLSRLLEQRSYIPTPLVEFGAKVLRNEIPEPKEQGGAAGKKDLGRACLVETISEIVEITGMNVTENDEKAKGEPYSAVYFVAQAAGISVPTAKKAWYPDKRTREGKAFMRIRIRG